MKIFSKVKFPDLSVSKVLKMFLRTYSSQLLFEIVNSLCLINLITCMTLSFLTEASPFSLTPFQWSSIILTKASSFGIYIDTSLKVWIHSSIVILPSRFSPAVPGYILRMNGAILESLILSTIYCPVISPGFSQPLLRVAQSFSTIATLRLLIFWSLN